MPISATGRREATTRSGFTLIELLVAMAIAAVLLAAVVLAWPDSAQRRGELAAQRALALLQLACERAERSGRDIGIGVSVQGLAFGPFAAGRWQPYGEHAYEPLRPRQLEAGVQLELELESRTQRLPAQPPERPQLACLAGGELTPFELRMWGPAQSRWLLTGSADGVLTLVPAP
jgi:type II secretion system protein H